jgi:hypothetical protein
MPLFLFYLMKVQKFMFFCPNWYIVTIKKLLQFKKGVFTVF